MTHALKLAAELACVAGAALNLLAFAGFFERRGAKPLDEHGRTHALLLAIAWLLIANLLR